MANVLSNLAADIYKSVDVVGRELVGAIPSATVNGDDSEQAAVGQTVRSAFTREATAVDITPSMTTPEGTDQTVDNKTLTMSKQRAVQIPWSGEDVKFANGGAGFETVYGAQIAQAMRALANEAEVDLCSEIYKNASRAVGTAGTTPFASDFDKIAELRQILVDNGMADDGNASLILNTAAGTKLRNLAQLQKANEAGGDNLLRQGQLLNLQNIMIKESAGIQSHTKGTGSGYLINGGEAIGQTTLTLDTGTGTILAGDILTHASDSDNKYVVNTALSGGDVVIGDTGLLVAAADNDAVTVGNSYTANFAFHRSAAEIAFRAPASPVGGDSAVDVMIVQDPYSGLAFEVSIYKGFKKAMIMVGMVWGVKAWRPRDIALLLG
jgi:hypothetical protein